jgi:hypothetical protein
MSADGQTKAPTNARAAESAAHPLPIGTVIDVLRLPASAPPFVEGQATIRRRGNTPHWYWVQFAGEPTLKLRLVPPGWHIDADQALASPHAHEGSRWNNESIIEDFFPDVGS